MRIRRIRLRNYRRYRDAEAELPDGAVAVLGRNGSGKSSLLEAISFALFGPAAIRTAKELLRSDGAAPGDPLRVEMDLELGGQAVRIVRELRGKALAPSASLEVDGVVLVPPGGGSSEAATREVERRLGLDREAFHTTVVAQQGELARLAEAKPADRKRLILRMLGIDRVDAAIEQARARRNAAAGALDRLRALAPDLAALEARAGALAADVESACAAAAAAGGRAAAAASESAAAVAAAEREEQAAQAARAEAVRLAALRAEESQLAQALARLRPELAQAEAAGRQAEGLAPLAAQVEAREEGLRAATLREAARGQHLERLRYAAHQRQAVQRLQADLDGLAAAALGADVPGVDGMAASQGVVVVESALQGRLAELAFLEAELRQVEQRRQRFEQLGPGSPCPLCERPLEGDVGHLRHEASASFEGLLSRCRAAQDDVARLRLEAQGARRAAESASRQAAEAQQAVLRRQDLERRVAEESRRLAELEAAIGPAPPAAPDLARLRSECQEARRAREEQARLSGLASRIPALAGHVAQATTALAAATQARQALEAVHRPPDEALLAQMRRQRDQATTRAQAAERDLHTARLAEQQAHAVHAAALRDLEQGRAMHAQVAELEKEVQTWNSLAGRAGGGLLDRFRDHLVGRIGPAVSAEASRLAARFTGGRYTEVLLDGDHQVFVTDHGVPYALERFSGGEADVVHLALRLAVSRLLAERGGVELRFLALDEVFGSLDRERRGHVVAALQELGTLYSQVLVVSHLEGLQEELGQVLRVGEGPEGEAILSVE